MHPEPSLSGAQPELEEHTLWIDSTSAHMYDATDIEELHTTSHFSSRQQEDTIEEGFWNWLNVANAELNVEDLSWADRST